VRSHCDANTDAGADADADADTDTDADAHAHAHAHACGGRPLDMLPLLGAGSRHRNGPCAC
jgi:hypothetical protein